MRVRNVDKNWDWTFGQSDTNYVKGSYAIGLNIKMRLQEWYQDCFFAKDKGIPWQIRLGFKNQKQYLDRNVIDTAQNVEGVLSLSDFQSTVDGRRYTCSFNVYTIYSADAQPITFDSENI